MIAYKLNIVPLCTTKSAHTALNLILNHEHEVLVMGTLTQGYWCVCVCVYGGGGGERICVFVGICVGI